jgi:hypothetical protein
MSAGVPLVRSRNSVQNWARFRLTPATPPVLRIHPDECRHTTYVSASFLQGPQPDRLLCSGCAFPRHAFAVSLEPQRQPHGIRRPGGRPRLAFEFFPRRSKLFT